MEEVRLTLSEAILYQAIRFAIVGFVIGLVPLITGIVKKKVKLGVIGLLVSTIGGALVGVYISIPAMAIFTWLILREPVAATNAPDPQSEPDPQESKEN